MKSLVLHYWAVALWRVRGTMLAGTPETGCERESPDDAGQRDQPWAKDTCEERHAKLVAEAPAKKKTRPLKPKLMVSQKASSVPFSTTLQGPMNPWKNRRSPHGSLSLKPSVEFVFEQKMVVNRPAIAARVTISCRLAAHHTADMKSFHLGLMCHLLVAEP